MCDNWHVPINAQPFRAGTDCNKSGMARNNTSAGESTRNTRRPCNDSVLEMRMDMHKAAYFIDDLFPLPTTPQPAHNRTDEKRWMTP